MNLTPLISAVCALTLAACATSRLDAQWRDAQFVGQTLGGAKVLVVCQAPEQTVIRICQDQLAAQLRLLGFAPVMSEGLSGGAEKTVAVAQSLGAQAVMLATLSQTIVIYNTAPSMGFGIGSGGYRGVAGFGMSMPMGGNLQTSATVYSSDTTLTHVASGRLIWSGKASTDSTLDLTDQIAGLAKVSVESARKAGML